MYVVWNRDSDIIRDYKSSTEKEVNDVHAQTMCDSAIGETSLS